ncbi:MAG: glycosyltransferase family 2 protein [Actinomycetota bacterium]|nr:glycosyltransferase family 2 protein [Actinomycetota bacterium]
MAPPVVAVVVAHNPGDWFEETMRSLVDQDYPNLSILVIDAGSDDEVKPRVARTAPAAFVRRLEDNPGFGAAANELLEVVDGATFYVICHDDVALAPDAVRVMLEEAFRSNAAVVGPKLVDWDDPRRLLQIGEGSDHAGYAVPLVERGELDQEQHDAVRDVFSIPGACTLVRADLFAEIGGFDEGIDYFLDDVSLCWRTHVAGARVIVAPDARVRHLEALAARRPADDRRRLQTRHRLRVLLSSTSFAGLLFALPKLIVVNLLEFVYTLIVGRTRNARDIVAAWTWNLRRIGELREARQHVNGFRRVPDREVRNFMTRGSARLNQFVRGQLGGGEDRLAGWARTGRDAAGALRSGALRFSFAAWGGVLLLLLAGSRHLITRGVPAVGELVPFSSSPVDLLRTFASGWRTAGLGSEAPAPTAFGLFGVGGFVFVGAMGALRTVVTVGLIPLGAFGIYRLAGPLGSRYAQIAALLTYVANPLPYNALANGQWGALALYAAVPTMVSLLGRAGRLAPFGEHGGATGPGVAQRSFGQLVLRLGIVTALVATITPVAIAFVIGIAMLLLVGSLLVYRVRGTGGVLSAAVGAALVAVALHLPWSVDFFLPGTPLSAFTGLEAPAQYADLGRLLRFEVGPLGAPPIGWAFLVAAALPLLIGSGERHRWAVRSWSMALGSFALAWASQRGTLPFALPPVQELLVPAAVGLSFATAMGVAAFQVDLPGYRFGWRQLASGLAAAAVAVAMVPVLGAAFDGRWSMPAGDHHRALGFMDAENEDTPFRVLWLGNPAALPLGSWELTDDIAYGTTDDGNPRLEDLLVGSDDGRTALLADAVDLARRGETARLGRLLAPMGVRYVVVPERLAPDPFAKDRLPLDGSLLSTLDAQLDLEPLDVPAGLNVWRNQAFTPTRAAFSGEAVPDTTGGIAGAANLDLGSAEEVLVDRDGPLGWSGSVPDDVTVLFSAGHSSRWTLEVGGQEADRQKAFGWANRFEVTDGGPATLSYSTAPTRYLFIGGQALVWLWALRQLLKRPERTPQPELAVIR